MKFTGILASLAVASTAYSAAIPSSLDSLPVGQLNVVTEKVSGVQGLLGGLLGGLPLVGDLTQNTQLKNLKSELSDLETTLKGLSGSVSKRDGTEQVTQLAEGIVKKAENSALEVEGLTNLLSQLSGSTAGVPLVGDLLDVQGLLGLL
ncbi:uncharacterized protein BDW47DRAFT_7159 [Aspergillus candidus]|uniref:Hydrophobic surface binding protein A-domain-containing protein n=1 Tax=Aspergillus candidus TaxID=41067 RepID=A0A2I2EXS1_ASPCN|nr:hypothetical protein BDW47DRAFT_7159 [Aspergillus candidus]PLB33168.1 hypothetical protein BDW47DRAFT_7159 [Aspergillus candidus]